MMCCERHDVEFLAVLGCPECANERCIPERLTRREAATMPPSAADAIAEAIAARMAREGEAGVRWELLMQRLEEQATNLENLES